MKMRSRVFIICMLMLLSTLLLPVIGMPYESFPVLASSLLQYGEKATATPLGIITVLEVDDQDASTGMVIIRRADVDIRSWILIHNQRDSDVGDVIGEVIVLFGQNQDIVVPIDLEQATPVLYASLHADWGQKEVYDPELDVQTTPYIPFEVTLPVAPMEEIEATITPTTVPPAELPPDELPPDEPLSPTPPPEVEQLTRGLWPLIAAICVFGIVVGATAGVVIFYLVRRRRE